MFNTIRWSIAGALITLCTFCEAGAKNLSAFFSYSIFQQPGTGPYVETYLNIDGHSVKLAKNSNNFLQSTIEVQWKFTHDSKVFYMDRYNLHGPEIKDSLQRLQDFIDLQRIVVPEGDYQVELKITDKNSPEEIFTSSIPISVHFTESQVSISDIEFLESFSADSGKGTFIKNGYRMIPQTTNFFSKASSSLKFYSEIYNTGKILGDTGYLVRYYISGHQNNQVIADLVGFRKQKPAAVNVLMAELPLESVLSGNYNLVIEVKNKSNRILAQRQFFFQRSNPDLQVMNPDDFSSVKINNTFVTFYSNKDTLAEYISSLYPISTSPEQNLEETQLTFNSLESMQQFFYYFWARRNPGNPEQAWLDYNKDVQLVNAAYSCPARKGYETDRGRVYLQYGQPNSIDKTYFEGEGMFEGSTYPYEIWQYNKTLDQTNVKFIFVSRNLSTNCFELIHSTARGEIYDPNWQTRLRDVIGTKYDNGLDYDHSSPTWNSNSRATDEFNHPK